MRKVVHILRYFGHPNQSYTTKLLESLNLDSSKLTHAVVCDFILKNSKGIQVFETNSYKALFYNPLVCFRSLKLVLLDSFYNEVTKDFSFKNKFKKAVKWLPLWQQKPDVIHIHHLQVIDLWLLKYIKRKNIKCILSLRGMELMRDTLNREDQKLFLEKIACVDNVHVISQFMYDYALEKGISKSKLVRVYRGFDRDFILPENLKTSIYNNGKLIKIIAVGRLAWEKGHDQLLESVARLKQKGYKMSLDIYGEGPLEAYLKFRAYQLELTKEVCFKGQLPNQELKRQYKKYDVAVQPSLFEALSNGLMDMAIHQLPCVIPNVGGMPEIISHQQNGIIYNPNHSEALDQAILNAIFLDNKSIENKANNLKETFSIKKEIAGLREMYLSNS